MSIYSKAEIKDRKRVRECQIVFAIITIICTIWTLIAPLSINIIKMLIISLIDVGAGQFYLDKTTIFDLQDQIND